PAAQLIQLDGARTVVAGGTESMSQIPFVYTKDAVGVSLRLGRARKWWQRLGALLRFRPRHFKPVPAVQLGLTDPVCGLIMGETAEGLDDDFHITRQEQGAYALCSHRRAGGAQKRTVLAVEKVHGMSEPGRVMIGASGPSSGV